MIEPVTDDPAALVIRAFERALVKHLRRYINLRLGSLPDSNRTKRLRKTREKAIKELAL